MGALPLGVQMLTRGKPVPDVPTLGKPVLVAMILKLDIANPLAPHVQAK